VVGDIPIVLRKYFGFPRKCFEFELQKKEMNAKRILVTLRISGSPKTFRNPFGYERKEKSLKVQFNGHKIEFSSVLNQESLVFEISRSNPLQK
jgi:hypothetical protein